VKTSTEEIRHNMDIEDRDGDAEYILPCVIDVLSEDDIILEFGISASVSMVCYFNANCICFILTLIVL